MVFKNSGNALAIVQTRLRSEVFSLESLLIWFGRFIVLTKSKLWPNYKILASHAFKLYKFERLIVVLKRIMGHKKSGPKNF